MSLELYRGEQQQLNFTITDSSGSTIDISNAEVYFVVSNKLPAGEKIMDVEAISESADGTCIVNLTETETDIEPKIYYFEVWVEFADGSDYSAEVGRIFVRKRVEK